MFNCTDLDCSICAPPLFNLVRRIHMAVELAAGYVLNIRLGLGVWDYSGLPFNIGGQICALFGLLWVLLVPLAVWLEDKLNLLWNDRYGVSYNEMYDYTLLQAYRELLFG